LLAIALVCVWSGGFAFALLVALCCLVLAREWVAMCGYAATDRPMLWMPILVVAAALSSGLEAAGGGLVVVLLGTAAALVVPSRRGSDAPHGGIRHGPDGDIRHGPAFETRHGPARPGQQPLPRVARGGPIEPGPDGTPGVSHDGTPNAGHDGTPSDGHGSSTSVANDDPTSVANDIDRCVARGGHDPAANASHRSPSRLDLAFGFPYLGLAAVALPWLRADPAAGLANTLFVLSVVWASDVGAYLVGRLIGGPKLAPAISPGKTWSGAAGGLLSAPVAGLAVAACFSTGFSPLHVTGLALGFGIISQAGDLLESALKRHFGVKDSGRIIPGHGGLLDRVDALLAVAPVAALLALTVGRGVVLWR
jgi:CDP-diglyceride synthetase